MSKNLRALTSESPSGRPSSPESSSSSEDSVQTPQAALNTPRSTLNALNSTPAEADSGNLRECLLLAVNKGIKTEAWRLTFLIHQFGFAVQVGYFVGAAVCRHLVEEKKTNKPELISVYILKNITFKECSEYSAFSRNLQEHGWKFRKTIKTTIKKKIQQIF